MLASLYLAFSLIIALSWQMKPLEGFMPDAISRLIYPIYKSHLAPLRLLHFFALAILVSRLMPPDWHGLMKPWMMAMICCGENSLAIFCLGVLLSFMGLVILSAIFQHHRYAGCYQRCRDRSDDRRSDSDDLDFQTGSAGAKAVLRRGQLVHVRCRSLSEVGARDCEVCFAPGMDIVS